MPDVSVIIPTYDRRGFLEEAIESCFAGNDALDVEVVVVDDGSTDGTRDWLRSLDDERVRPVFQEHQGAQVARNRGMDEARGTFVKFLDDDDWLAPGALPDEAERLRRTGTDVCHGHLFMSESSSKELRAVQQNKDRDLAASIFRESMWTPPHGFLYRRDVIGDARWDVALPYHQDYAFALGVACRGATAAGVDRPVGAIRQHEGPRIGTNKRAAPRAKYYALKVELIVDGIQRLENRGALRAYHRRAAADGIWNWAHIVAANDLPTFKMFYQEIERLVSGYQPERSSRLLRGLDALLGPQTTEQLTLPLRQAKAVCGRVL